MTKTQKYAVLWLNSLGETTEKISKELGLSEKQIDNLVKTNKPKNAIKTKTQPVGSSPSKNLMIRETANKNKHVAIMTKEASMVNDEAKKKNTTKKVEKNIFKINNGKSKNV